VFRVSKRGALAEVDEDARSHAQKLCTLHATLYVRYAAGLVGARDIRQMKNGKLKFFSSRKHSSSGAPNYSTSLLFNGNLLQGLAEATRKRTRHRPHAY
jgi:hypothetical protein